MRGKGCRRDFEASEKVEVDAIDRIGAETQRLDFRGSLKSSLMNSGWVSKRTTESKMLCRSQFKNNQNLVFKGRLPVYPCELEPSS
eukprot:337499-Hanusia_phi.AAC.4